jgi:anti-sigma factor RsiW
MNTKSHPIEPEELMAYLDGELPPDQATRAADHMGTCRECQSLASDLRRMSERMLEWQVETPDFSAPRQEAAAKKEEQVRRRWYLWKPVWVATAAIALVIGAVVLQSSGQHAVFLQTDLPSGALTLAPPQQRAVDGRGRRTNIDLARAGNQLALGPAASSVGPLIARSAGLEMVANDFTRAADAVQAILKRHRGYAAEMNMNAAAEAARTLDFSLRTPETELDSTIVDLKALGRVTRESRAGEDVTRQSTDLDARLANAKNREQVLTDLMKHRAARLSDVLEVEEHISSTRGEIEQMEAERKNLNQRIEFARIDLRITEVYRAQLDGNRTSTSVRLRNAAVAGGGNLRDSLVGAAAFLLSAGPLLLVWCALLIVPSWFFWRWRRSR